MDIRLDKETFKALASGTRVDVLKILDKRRHMQSEIADSLELSVPTVKEHLSALEKAGLVERHDEGRKWKYYSLTKKGKGLLHPDELKIWIVLGTFVLSVAGGIVSALRNIKAPEPVVETMAMKAMDAAPMMATAELAQTVPQAVNYWSFVFGVVAVVSAFILAYLLYRSSSYRRQLGKSLSKK